MKKTAKKRKPKKLTAWKEEFLVKVYRLARSGLGDMAIAKTIGVTYGTFVNWRKAKKSIRDALKEGRAGDQEPMSTFRNFCYGRLPDHLKETWDEIMECEEGGSLSRLEAMLKDHGRRGRQHLFLHALIHYNFNISDACRAVNISRKRFNIWAVSDPDFAELVEEMAFHKANFFESALIELVKSGDSAAIRMVNATYNANRGYGNKTTINKNVTVSGKVEHVGIPIEELGLSLDERKRVLALLREKKDNKEGRVVQLEAHTEEKK